MLSGRRCLRNDVLIVFIEFKSFHDLYLQAFSLLADSDRPQEQQAEQKRAFDCG